jgi:DNA-binding XRE family transcriptional regulator
MSHFDPVEPKSKEDIRAARAYLNWTQPELAVRVGCNPCTINTLEQGKHAIGKNLSMKIAEVFAKEGIKFNYDGGFKLEKDVVKIYEGEDSYLKILDDIYHVCLNTNKEVLLLGVDDRKSNDKVIEKKKELYKSGIIFKHLISTDCDNYAIGPLEDYRSINIDFFFSKDVVIIYDNKIVISFLDYKNRSNLYDLISIEHIGLYNEMSRYFKNLWVKANKIDKSNTEQIYFKK